MPNPPPWPVPARFLAGALILYSVLLCVVSWHVFSTTFFEGVATGRAAGVWEIGILGAPGVIVFILTFLFPALLLLGLWRPRLAGAMLLAGAGVLLALTLTASHHAESASAGVVGASLLFLGVPMLGSAILFQRIGRGRSAPEG